MTDDCSTAENLDKCLCVGNNCCNAWVLSQHDDFLQQKSWLGEECEKLGVSVIYFTRNHCVQN
jgi:hypothetical protein